MLNIKKKIGLTTLCTLSLLLLQGCVTTAIVGTAAVATKVATDPRTAGRQLDDETLEEKVAFRLNKDAQLQQEARINVVAYNGRVLLIGQVPNQAAKDAAKSIADGVEGVSAHNELRIGPKIGLGQISQDGWITTDIKSRLLLSPSVKSTDVKVITENAEVFLLGNLPQSQMNAAAEVARNVKSARVKKVILLTATPANN